MERIGVTKVAATTVSKELTKEEVEYIMWLLNE
jgi:hypothetical protein